MERYSYQRDFSVVQDCGYGRCYSRGADTIEEAMEIMNEWKVGEPGSFRVQTWDGEFVAGEQPAPDPHWY
ncbi:hypothetical protein [Rhizobium sp. RU36D]|uniref:hypothetical protein n=1 Tax=Rhizobium sp. RU36D TaxID=1907415 RepID=UPI0009D8FE6F|nr:hypothetical protein [Rhizobium sp. RU36D]SMD16382.1 hypothetical protein SAMN05880593_12971 [Rhizobium sp. RU36D]